MSAQPHSSPSAWTIGRLLKWTSEYLTGQGLDDARLASEVMLAHAMSFRRIDLFARFDEVPDERQTALFRSWVRRAAAREPIAYLVGQKEFFSLAFSVTSDVLIPRPETETLVEGVIDYCRENDLAHPRILDVGTGSGCVAVAILSQITGASAVGSDVCPAALDVATMNAKQHGVGDRFHAVHVDRLAVPSEAVPDGGFDVLVCNPPYVPVAEFDRLDATVREYEPRIALTDEGDGLSFYRSIATDGVELLGSDGAVMVEVGDDRAECVVEAMSSGKRLVHRHTLKDRVAAKDRVLIFGLRDGA